jgi:hypothetical protein
VIHRAKAENLIQHDNQHIATPLCVAVFAGGIGLKTDPMGRDRLA